ncbi:uncharacterized protein zgc:193726 [Pseudorasbora parva]|uniref:uncharacterized protein zgc:193726 n=1 Tax=Pseudorasbora parva TaxID=51549 RepID=UPI00351DE340
MNSMFPVWTLSSLILSYTLAYPILNNTSMESDTKIFPNFTEFGENGGPQIFPGITEGNTTKYIKANPTNRSETRSPTRLRRICFLSTCSLWNLGSSLQTGNEIAGDMHDPMGIGKK